MKFDLKFSFRSFLTQNAGKFKAEILLKCSHNFNVVCLKQFHKKLFMIKSNADNWDLLRVQASIHQTLAYIYWQWIGMLPRQSRVSLAQAVR